MLLQFSIPCLSVLHICHENMRPVRRLKSSALSFTVLLRFLWASSFCSIVIALWTRLFTPCICLFHRRCSNSNFSPLLNESNILINLEFYYLLYRVRNMKCNSAIALKLLVISKNVLDKSFSVREGRHIRPPNFFIGGHAEVPSKSTPLF